MYSCRRTTFTLLAITAVRNAPWTFASLSSASSTGVFHAAILVSAASAAQLAAGNVNVGMALSLLLGSIPGVLLGSRLAVGFPEQLLRFSLAGVLLVSGAKLL